MYEREKMKRPQGSTDTQVSQLGFQYLLRYYSLKDDLIKYFTANCPMFKPKLRGSKHYIVDVVRHCEKPIMSASQLKDFFQKIHFEDKTEQECLKLIKSYPVYDG